MPGTGGGGAAIAPGWMAAGSRSVGGGTDATRWAGDSGEGGGGRVISGGGGGGGGGIASAGGGGGGRVISAGGGGLSPVELAAIPELDGGGPGSGTPSDVAGSSALGAAINSGEGSISSGGAGVSLGSASSLWAIGSDPASSGSSQPSISPRSGISDVGVRWADSAGACNVRPSSPEWLELESSPSGESPSSWGSPSLSLRILASFPSDGVSCSVMACIPAASAEAYRAVTVLILDQKPRICFHELAKVSPSSRTQAGVI